jgi:hypothetical protein
MKKGGKGKKQHGNKNFKKYQNVNSKAYDRKTGRVLKSC